MWGGLLRMSLTDGSPDFIGLVPGRERFIDALAAQF
jgi:hypothetical protein